MNYANVPKFALIGATAVIGLIGTSQVVHAANFTGDGRDDLVVGAPGKAIGIGPRSGAAFLYRGFSYGVSPTELIDQGGLDINQLGDKFGSSFAAGDFDGDGEDDLAIGAPGKGIGMSLRSGAVFVYSGSSGGLQPMKTLDQSKLGLNEWGDRFGETLVAADFNGDGFDDLAVAAPGEAYGPGKPTGVVYMFMGSKIGLLPIQVVDQGGLGINEPGDMFGTALSAGDYNNDGWMDLAVGAPGESPGADPQSGLVFIYAGSSSGLAPELTIDQSGLGANEDDDRFGMALTSADFNDDGFDDLAVGAPGEAPGTDPKSGAVFIYRGSSQSLKPRQVVSQAPFDHNESGDEFGAALSSGDYNGDGRDDLAVGVPGENLPLAPDAGAVLIFRGDPTNLVPLQLVTQVGLGADQPYDRFGSALSTGNYIGDDLHDLAIGAPGETRSSAIDSGSVYLMRGTRLGLTPARIVNQSSLGTSEAKDMFGAALCE